VKYFFDNDISYRFAEMLSALGVDAVALRHLYPTDVKDIAFLGELKTKHRVDVFISDDSAQRINPIEAALLRQSGVTCLHFNQFWGKLKFWQQAKWLVSHWEKIDGFARGVVAGTCADLKANGRAEFFNW
jgi:hypothetical protein